MNNCLSNLLKFRDFCDTNYTGKYVNDFVDVNSTILANLANENELTGKQFGENLIQSGFENALSDLLSSNGDLVFSSAVEKLNYDGRFVGSQSANNSGVILRNVTTSELSNIQIDGARLKPLFDGNFTIVIDNGTEQEEFEFVGQNGVETNFQFEYKTKAKVVKIFIKETNLNFAQATMNKTTCGSCSGKKFNIVAQTIIGLQPKSEPSIIIPSAFLICDPTDLICVLIKNPLFKQVFLKAVALQVGVALYDRLSLSNRLNDTTLNINSEAVSLYHNTLVGKYQETMFGLNFASGVQRSNVRPLVHLMKSSITNLKDICVNCNANLSTATAVW